MGNFYYSRFLDNCDRVVRWESDDDRVTWHLWLSRSLRGESEHENSTVQLHSPRPLNAGIFHFFSQNHCRGQDRQVWQNPQNLPYRLPSSKNCENWTPNLPKVSDFATDSSCLLREFKWDPSKFWDILWVDDFKDFKSCLHGMYMLKVGQGQPFCWCWLR